jgi:4-hydroxy-tetrahydrodipicolinate synthase
MVKDLADQLLAGNLEEARELHFRLLPLFKNLFIETNPIPVKTAVRLMGKPAGPFRLPLCDMDPSNMEVLKRTLADLGVI